MYHGKGSLEALKSFKGKKAMIPFEDRIEIVRSCKYVDAAVPQYDMDKLTACKKLGASFLFVGDDWYGTEKWQEYEKEFLEAGIQIIYFPYTKGISTTEIRQRIKLGDRKKIAITVGDPAGIGAEITVKA